MNTTTCPACKGCGYQKSPIHYIGLGVSSLTFCRDCPPGRELFREWAAKPQQRAYAERLKKEKINRALRLSCMGAQFSDGRLPDLIPYPTLCRACNRYIQNWPARNKRGQGLYFWGGAGTGKTHAAAVVVNELIARHLVETLFLSVPEAASRLKLSLSDQQSRDVPTLLDRMKRVELLVLDDLGVEKPSDWIGDLLYQVIDERWRERRPMLVTSDLSPAELARRYRPQLASRLRACCQIIRLSGPDKRQLSE